MGKERSENEARDSQETEGLAVEDVVVKGAIKQRMQGLIDILWTWCLHHSTPQETSMSRCQVDMQNTHIQSYTYNVTLGLVHSDMM